MAKPETSAKTCGNCAHFIAPKQPERPTDVANDFRGVFSVGDCFRFPRAERKKPNEFCGEFSPAKEA